MSAATTLSFNTKTAANFKTKATLNLNTKLQAIVAEALSLPRTSSKRRRKLNDIVRLVTCSGKLWYENTPEYEDALQQTWLYCLRNLEKYDPARSSFITWVDNTLKWRIKDVYRARTRKSSAYLSPDIAETIPAPATIPPILEETKRWIETDPDGELRNTHIHNRPDLNCQKLLMCRMPPEMPWKEIAQEFNVPMSTASNFYKRECLPRLRKFGVRQGYLA